jgi:hypothetical protein
MTDIREILDAIVNMNINRCSATTHDLSIQECARFEIIKGLAEQYNINYNINSKSQLNFPVAKGPNA